MRARRMDKRNPRAVRTWASYVVDQTDATGLELRECGIDVVDSQREVMEARPAFGNVLRDG